MRLKTVKLTNFRSYQEETAVDFDDLTALVGRNDVGKSTILDALDIFFASGTRARKMQPDDACVRSEDKTVRIACVFSDFEGRDFVIDAAAPTTLADEHLLNSDGNLEIVQEFNCGAARMAAPKIFVNANHPSAEGVSDLLSLKRTDLRTRMEELGVPADGVNRSSNVSMRQAIYGHANDLERQERLIRLDEEDGKKTYTKMRSAFPIFALFQSDRASRDEDAEVQDPIKVALEEALADADLQARLTEIEERVRNEVQAVADRTIEKLREMAPGLAEALSPDFKAAPSWAKAFSFTINDDQNIPLNKRGSGVRRLVLINFFRATAEERRRKEGAPQIIYAIEEPETSQHPDTQKLLVEAFRELAGAGSAQVILTTHVPGLAGLLPRENVRFIECGEDGANTISLGSEDDVMPRVARTLGVIPDSRVRVLVCVEGPNDVDFLTRVSKTLKATDPDVIDLGDDDRIAFMPLGGGTLKQWVDNHYAEGLERHEVHIFDRDLGNPPEYQAAAATVNARPDGRGFACLTAKRTLENYLHADAVQRATGVQIIIGDQTDVPEEYATAKHDVAHGAGRWAALSANGRRRLKGQAKRDLNTLAAAAMTEPEIHARDAAGDIRGWLIEIRRRAEL